MKISTKLALALLAAQSFAPSVLATDSTSKLFESAWSGMGFVLGYGNRDAYVKYACGGTDPGEGEECDGPPEIGLVRKFTSIADSVVEQLDYSTCSAVPATGSKTVKVDGQSVKVTFSTPALKIPKGWDGGEEKFDIRFEFKINVVQNDINMVLESSCKHPNTVVASMNMEVGDHAPDYLRHVNVWVGTQDSKTIANAYVSELKDGEKVRGAYGFALKINETAKTYELWGGAGMHYNDASTDQPVDVYNIVGNFVTHASSTRIKRFVPAGVSETNGSYMDADSLAAISGSSVATLPATTSFDLLADKGNVATGGTATAQGCMDYDKPTTAPTSADACADLDWSDAPTPVIDSEGTFSAAWIYNSMHKKLKEIPTIE